MGEKGSMVDRIIELDNDCKYVILDMKKVSDDIYYYGLRLKDNEEPSNKYLFFKETHMDNKRYLLPVFSEDDKNLLLTVFTVNYLDKVYDEI